MACPNCRNSCVWNTGRNSLSGCFLGCGVVLASHSSRARCSGVISLLFDTVMQRIQTPIAPIVHPKLNTGKEPFKCGIQIAKSELRLERRTTQPVAPAAFGMRKPRQDEQNLQDSDRGGIIPTILSSCLTSRLHCTPSTCGIWQGTPLRARRSLRSDLRRAEDCPPYPNQSLSRQITDTDIGSDHGPVWPRYYCSAVGAASM